MQESQQEALARYYCKKLHFEGGSQDDIEIPFEITSHQYLKYSEDDLNSDLTHRHINCLSNVKRAIHCQIDSLLYVFGLYDYAIEKRWDFPKKVDHLKQIGVITPRILGKINKNRNLLEHEYLNPNADVVEDALDVAELFVGYTDRFLKRPFIDASFVNEADTLWVNIELNHLDKRFAIREINTTKKGEREVIEFEISSDSDNYIPYLKFWIIHLSEIK